MVVTTGSKGVHKMDEACRTTTNIAARRGSDVVDIVEVKDAEFLLQEHVEDIFDKRICNLKPGFITIVY